MNVKWKIAFYVVVTLVIGIVIGALLNRALVQRHIRDALSMRAAGLLAPRAERFLKPLSPEQEKKIREILDKHAERMAEIHERRDREIQSSFKSLKEEIDPFLTPEQKAQFKRMIPGPPPFRRLVPPGFGFPGGPGFPGFELIDMRLRRELDLSEDQAGKIKDILEKSRSELRSLREEGEPPGKSDAFRQWREKLDQEIEKILTEEQKEKFRQFRKMRPWMPGEDELPGPPGSRESPADRPLWE